MNKYPKISTSILSADFAELKKEINLISKAGTDYIHIDIMDGNFVPNITIGPDVIKKIRPYSDKIFDVHLMINKPENFIEQFSNAGADILTFHYEATTHHDRIVKLIKEKKIKAGISLVPSTPPQILDYILEELDIILVMTVNPGFAGQSFLNSQLKKIEYFANKIATLGLKTELAVDGGINDKTAAYVINAGANVLIAGSYIFSKENNYQQNIEKLRNARY